MYCSQGGCFRLSILRLPTEIVGVLNHSAEPVAWRWCKWEWLVRKPIKEHFQYIHWDAITIKVFLEQKWRFMPWILGSNYGSQSLTALFMPSFLLTLYNVELFWDYKCGKTFYDIMHYLSRPFKICPSKLTLLVKAFCPPNCVGFQLCFNLLAWELFQCMQIMCPTLKDVVQVLEFYLILEND